MSLQKKIEDDMKDLAIRIIRKANSTNDEKLRRMCECWFDLERLSKLALQVQSE